MGGIYLGIVIVLILTIFFNVRTFRCFCKSGFVKTIASVMGILITIIGIFVGIFADSLLSHYENTYNNRHWFNPRTIISFPIEQLKYHALPTDAFDYPLFTDKHDCILKDVIDTLVLQRAPNKVNYIFVVDKTASGKPADNVDQNDLISFRQDIKKELERKQCKNANEIDCTTRFKFREDLMLVACLNAMCETKEDIIDCQVIIYNGENNKNDITKFQEIIEYPTMDSFLKEYNFIENKRATNFKDIIEKISISNFINDTTKTIITIFSDFFHEDHLTEVTFKELEESIRILKNKILKNKENIKGPNVLLNLVALNYSKNKTPINYKIKDSKDTVTINGRFSHSFSPLNDEININIRSYLDTANDINYEFDAIATDYNTRGIPIKLKTDTASVNNYIQNHITILAPNDTVDEVSKIEETKRLFRKHFHFEYKNIYNEYSITSRNDRIDFMVYLITYIRNDKFIYKKIQEKRSISRLTFRYPFSIGKMESTHSNLVMFDLDSKNPINTDKAFISIKDNSFFPVNFIFKLHRIRSNEDKETDKLELILSNDDEDVPKEIIFHKGDLYRIVFEIDKISDNMIFDIYVQDSVSKSVVREQIPIKFKTLLPKILCYIMIVFISMFGILLATLLIYFCFRLTICRYAYHLNEDMAKITGILVAFITGWLAIKVLITLVYYCIELYRIESLDYIHENSFFCQYSFVFLFIVLILVIAFILLISRINEYKHKNMIHSVLPPINCPYSSENMTSTTNIGQDRIDLSIFLGFGALIGSVMYLF